jgi:hypothetical protein
MAERLADLFVETGITRIIAEAVCKELLPNGVEFEVELIHDFKKSPKLWVEKVKNEMALFSAIGAFTCDGRFIDYLTKTKRLIFINDVYVLMARYSDSYQIITHVFRNSFKQHVLRDMKTWAPRLMKWDNYWTQDEEIGKPLLDEERSINRKEPVPDVPWLPSTEDYDDKVLFPALRALLTPSELEKLFMMKSGQFEFRDRLAKPHDPEKGKRFSPTERKALIALVDRLRVVPQLNKVSINTNFLNGHQGKPGFIEFLDRKANENPTRSAPGCYLTAAFEARRIRAELLVGDFKAKFADPGEFEELSKLFAEVNC